MADTQALQAYQKALIVPRHLSDREPISNVADELCIPPSRIHYWVKKVLD
jgi:hypothetical protein